MTHHSFTAMPSVDHEVHILSPISLAFLKGMSNGSTIIVQDGLCVGDINIEVEKA